MVRACRFLATIAVASLVFLPVSSAAQQRSGAKVGRFEVPWLDFSADGAWRTRTNQIRSARRSMLRNREFSALNAAGSAQTRVDGIYNVPVVLISYSNVAVGFTTAEYQDVLFSPAPTIRPYSVKSYYEEISRGLITMNGVVLDPVVMPQPDTFYEDDCDGIGLDPTGNTKACTNPGFGGTSIRFRDLLLGALAAADDGSVDWGLFDNDGPDAQPNSGDDNGRVDFVTFIQPEVDGACGTTNIWAHRFSIAGVSGGSAYVTQTPRSGGGFITINDYTIQSGQGGNGGCTPNQLMPIGTTAHETGHAFGLPDLYDTFGGTEGIGEWGLMGSGNYTRPSSPAGYEAWSLVEMGWVAVDTLTANGTVTLNPIQTSDTVLFIDIPATDEYFLLENRDSLLSDTAQMNTSMNARKKSPGLLIWHIDQGEVTSGTPSNQVNVGNTHGVALMQADGLNNLRSSPFNRGDAGDSYPGTSTNRAFTFTTNPTSRDNQGAHSGIAIDSIFRNSSGVPGVPSPIVFRIAFGTPITIVTVNAVNALLGVACLQSPCLTSQQMTFLDQNGNNDGTYNLGDFLAYADGSGLNPSSEPMQRVLSQPTISVPLDAPTQPKER